jgi:hypothetical protein
MSKGRFDLESISRHEQTKPVAEFVDKLVNMLRLP